MPGARTHDFITVASGLVLAPLSYNVLVSIDPAGAATGAIVLFGAHLLSGVMFSPDLDLDSEIDDRWGIFFWIWRPYMWLIPHRHYWSHGLIFPPLLRLTYFYTMLVLVMLTVARLLSFAGIVVPDYPARLADAIVRLVSLYPTNVLLFLLGFITGGAAHSIADWLVTGGKRYLRMLGIRLTRDYSNHDRFPNSYRRPTRSW